MEMNLYFISPYAHPNLENQQQKPSIENGKDKDVSEEKTQTCDSLEQSKIIDPLPEECKQEGLKKVYEQGFSTSDQARLDIQVLVKDKMFSKLSFLDILFHKGSKCLRELGKNNKLIKEMSLKQIYSQRKNQFALHLAERVLSACSKT